MSVNQFKIALRRMRNDHLGAFVSITGLAVAFASVMVIAGYIWDEWGFDRQPPDSGRIFRLTFDETPDRDGGRHLATVSPPVGPALVRKYPEVEQAEREGYNDYILMA